MNGQPPNIQWAATTPLERGPVVAGTNAGSARNAIGVHAAGFAIYQGLAAATGALPEGHRPNLQDTGPSIDIGPFPQWTQAGKIVSLDPWGHRVAEVFGDERARGLDIRPSIAVTNGRLRMPEISDSMHRGRLKADGHILTRSGDICVTKIAIEPVWWLPGIAERLAVSELTLREALFRCTDGMYPALRTRLDRKAFLPPIGGSSVYLFGDTGKLGDPAVKIACRIHDECSGSDVFGSDICTCRPYLALGVEEAICMAQRGGIGIVVYNRKEGRSLGEVVKLLVYNVRARSLLGDRPEKYFDCTEQVAGVQDMRFQALSVDVLHWLGVNRVERWISMSNLKSDALVAAGIKIVNQVAIPDEIIPAHAHVEISAKQAAGYFSTIN
jgi:GTP cyclohydrolase II